MGKELKYNITDLKQSKNTIMEGEERYRAIFNYTFNFTGLMTLDGILLDANQAALAFIGLKLEDVINQPFWEIPCWHGKENCVKQLKDAITIAASGDFVRYEVELQGADDRTIIFDFSIKPVFSSDGKVTFLISEGRDITDRKQIDEALRKSEEYYRTVADFAYNWEYWKAPDGSLLYVSPSCERITGYRVKEFKQDPELLSRILHPEDYQQFTEHIHDIKVDNEPYVKDIHIITRSGEERWLVHTCQPVYNQDGKYLGRKASNRDITEHKEAEKDRQYYEKFLQTVLSISNSFISITSDAIDAAIQRAVSQIGEFGVVDRCYVFLFDDETEETMSNTHEWCAYGIEPQKNNLQSVSVSDFPWWMDRLRSNEVIDIQQVAHMPQEAAAEMEILKEQSIQSILVVPIRLQNRLIGFLGFDTVRQSHVWPKRSITLIRMLADILANAIERKRTETRLLENEANYRTFFETIDDMLVVGTTDGRIIYTNTAMTQKLGYSPEELRTMQILDLHPPWVREEAKSILSDMFKGKRTTCPLPLANKNGSLIPVETRAWSGKWSDTNCIFGISKDLSKEQEALQKFEKLFRMNPALMAVSKISDRTFVDINNAFLHTLGYSMDELIGKTSAELKLFVDAAAQERVAQLLADNNHIREIELKVKTKDGNIREGLFSGELLESQGVKYFLTVMSDITEKKQAEAELKKTIIELIKSEKKYRQLIELANEGVWVIDAVGNTTLVNPKMAEMSGYTEDEMIGRHIFSFMVEKQVEMFRNNLECYKNGIKEQYDFVFLKKNGQEIYTIMSISDITDDNGNYAGAIALVTDITDRKIAEEEKEKLQTQLLQAQKMESIGRLAGGIAHNFNNMMGIILGNVELAMNVAPTESVHTYLEIIRKTTKRATNITRQLLAFARRQTAVPIALNLNETVNELLEMLQHLIRKDIDLSWKPYSSLENVKIDPTQIDQILTNLLLNAQDAITGIGKITIETNNVVFDEAYCALHKDFVPGKYVMLMVSDNGCGMDKETLANIFEPFFTTKEIYKGAGLGLSTVYGIVRQNNGFINAYSEPGAGTTFWIYLPQYIDRTGPASVKSPAVAAKGGNETILLVEDESMLMDVTKSMLKKLGYTVLAADKADEAFRIAGEYKGELNLLITDVVMPKMNGQELARKLLALYPNLRCLFMSSYTAESIVHYGVQHEGVQFIQKPFFMKTIADKVREILDSK